jgi:ABC-2 type transport system ATP-binding protein
MNTIEIKNITKTFGNVKALDNVSAVFEPNKIYGLLGRNGAGKTTLINVVHAPLVLAAPGTARVVPSDPVETTPIALIELKDLTPLPAR